MTTHCVMLVLNDVAYDRRVRAEAAALADAGWRVLVIGTQRADGSLPDSEQLLGFDLLRVRYGRFGAGLWPPWRWVRHAFQAWQIMRVLWRVEADVWHAHDLHALMVMVLARWFARRRVKLVYDAHELMLFMSPPGTGLTRWGRRLTLPVEMWIERALARQADAILALCEPRARALALWYGLPMPVVVRNLLDPDRGQRAPLVDLRTVVGPDRFCVVHTGDITNRGRCLTELVAALARLPESVSLVFLGQGEAESDLRGQAATLGVADRVHFVPPVPPEDVAAVIARADAAAILLRHESTNIRLAIPNKLWEALAAGLPVVTSDSYALRRIVEPYGLGVVCDSLSPDAIATGLTRVSSRTAHSHYRANVLAAQNELNWTREREKLSGVYRELTGIN